MADAMTVVAGGVSMRCISARLLHPWRGAWLVDALLDPDSVASVPTSGPATVTIGGATLSGTVDPRGSGSFVAGASMRIQAGGGGWDKPVPPLHYHADNGVRSTPVYQAAAAIVGEQISDDAPVIFGVDYMRSAGPASRVFGDLDWYVDLAGVTHTGPRPAAAADGSLTLIDWVPIEQKARLTCDVLVLPGTPLSDPRLNGASPIVRDVEQLFDADGSHVTAWCSTTAVQRLIAALTNAVRELARTATLKVYAYRIVLEGSDGRLQLQAVNPTAGMPDTLPLSAWPGMAGDSAQHLPGTRCLVHFVEGPKGLPPQPVVLGFDPTSKPEKRTVDASLELDLGPSAPLVALAKGLQPIALAPPLTTLMGAIQTWSIAVSGALSTAGFPIAAAQAALESALDTAAAGTPAQNVTAS